LRTKQNRIVYLFVAIFFKLCALKDVVPLLDRRLHPQPGHPQVLARRAHIADQDQTVAAIHSRRQPVGGARHAGIKAIIGGVTLLGVLDHGVDAGIPGGVGVGLVEKTLQITAGLDLDFVVHLVVDRQHGFDQLCLIEVKDALGVFGLLLDL